MWEGTMYLSSAMHEKANKVGQKVQGAATAGLLKKERGGDLSLSRSNSSQRIRENRGIFLASAVIGSILCIIALMYQLYLSPLDKMTFPCILKFV